MFNVGLSKEVGQTTVLAGPKWSEKVKQSRYTPWRRLGGEEV
jgi:hypothetical protein